MNQIRLSPRLGAATAGLLLSASAFASTAVDVYAGGEAMPPEQEARLIAQTTGALTRAEVREQLAEARATGTLAGGGELSDSDELLRARVAYNEQQTRMLVARYEAEAQRLTAVVAPAPERADAPALPSGTGLMMGAAPAPAGDVPSRESIEPATEQLVGEAPAPAPERPGDPAERPQLSADELPLAKPEDPMSADPARSE